MSKKLVITLDEATTQKYLELASQQTESLVNEGCEPADVVLKIQVGANQHYENAVFLMTARLAKLQWSGQTLLKMGELPFNDDKH